MTFRSGMLPISPDTEQEAAEALHRYGWTDASWSAGPSGFSGAALYRVQRRGETFCLRRWPSLSLPAERLRALHRWLRRMTNSAAAPLATPLALPGGDTLCRVGACDWQLEPWLPGEADFAQRPTAERMADAMRTLARLHLASAADDAPQGDREWFAMGAGVSPSVAFRLELLAALTPVDAAALQASLRSHGSSCEAAIAALQALLPLRAGAMRQLREMQTSRTPLFPCLRDVWRDHVLFSGDCVTGIIDPSAARAESPACDVSRLVGSLAGEDRSLWTTALDAYQQVRPLSFVERRLIAALDVTGVMLSALHWVRRLADGDQSIAADPRVEQRLLEFTRRMLSMQHNGPACTAAVGIE